jgi:predicted methyltransferase
MKRILAKALLVGIVTLQCAAADAATTTGSDDQGRPATNDKALSAAVNGDWRSEEAKARDRYRHPIEALTFWGLKPGMTILEIQPGSQSWWTDILAPYAKATGGAFYVTGADLANPKLSEGSRKARSSFEARYLSKPELYGDVRILNWGAVSKTLPASTFDLILTARSVHGWMQQEGIGTVEETFAQFYRALKKGGILAVEQHRAKPGTNPEKPSTGYVTEAYVIEQAQKAGFTLAGKSEINANPKDTRDHPFGVWTLPPTLQSAEKGEDPAFDKSKYLAIGESDRMTLRFVKK